MMGYERGNWAKSNLRKGFLLDFLTYQHNGADTLAFHDLKMKKNCQELTSSNRKYATPNLQRMPRIQKKHIHAIIIIISRQLGENLQSVAREVPPRAVRRDALRHGVRVVHNHNLWHA
jgi:hypothetical protein